jgi:hypothetical protein
MVAQLESTAEGGASEVGIAKLYRRRVAGGQQNAGHGKKQAAIHRKFF